MFELNESTGKYAVRGQVSASAIVEQAMGDVDDFADNFQPIIWGTSYYSARALTLRICDKFVAGSAAIMGHASRHSVSLRPVDTMRIPTDGGLFSQDKVH